jgi:hypothetical protein
VTLTGREFQREAADDLDKWTDQMLASAAREGHKLEREWLRSWLADFSDAVRKNQPPPVI